MEDLLFLEHPSADILIPLNSRKIKGGYYWHKFFRSYLYDLLPQSTYMKTGKRNLSTLTSQNEMSQGVCEKSKNTPLLPGDNFPLNPKKKHYKLRNIEERDLLITSEQEIFQTRKQLFRRKRNKEEIDFEEGPQRVIKVGKFGKPWDSAK